MILEKVKKELERFKKRLFFSGEKHKQLEEMQYKLDNQPYELYDKANPGTTFKTKWIPCECRTF